MCHRREDLYQEKNLLSQPGCGLLREIGNKIAIAIETVNVVFVIVYLSSRMQKVPPGTIHNTFFIAILIKMVTSMLVTDFGSEICCSHVKILVTRCY